jgi:excisionase family DNA binding protein
MKNDKVFLRAKDVAQILDICPDDVYKPIRRGELQAIKKGRTWLFRYEDVMAYKEQKEEILATR